MADFLSDKRAEIDSRLKELRPLHEEYLKLERAKQALDGLDEPRRGPGRPAGSGTRSGSGSGSGSGAGSRSGSSNGRRRRRAGGTAAEHALAAVRQNPGITVAELAPKLGIKHKNYLYRVMSGLQEEGALRKDGRGYHAS